MDEERAFRDLSDEEKETAYQDLLKERRDLQRLIAGFVIVMALASAGEGLIRGEYGPVLFGAAVAALLFLFMMLLAAQGRARERQRERERHTY